MHQAQHVTGVYINIEIGSSRPCETRSGYRQRISVEAEEHPDETESEIERHRGGGKRDMEC